MQLNAHALVSTMLVLTAAGFGLPVTAQAAQDIVNATGTCNGALPGYEGALRKRPLAIANEGAASAFVNCALTTDGSENPGYLLAGLVLVNRNAGPVAVNCTFVSGAAAEVAELGNADLLPLFYPRLIAVPAGAAALAQWSAADEGLATFSSLANFSCALPPMVEINVVTGAYIPPP